MDSNNNIHVTGFFHGGEEGIDFDVTDEMDIHSANGTDVFLIKYSDNNITTHLDEVSNEKINIFPNPAHVNEIIKSNDLK